MPEERMKRQMFTNEDAVWINEALAHATTMTVILGAVPDEGEDTTAWLAIVRKLKADRKAEAGTETPAAVAARACLDRLGGMRRSGS
jgi:TctA family transporter